MPRDFISNIDEANQTVATLDGQIATANATLEARQNELVQARTDLDARSGELTTVRAELAASQGDLTSARARIAELETASRTAAEQATTIVAGTGTKPVASAGGGVLTLDPSLKGLQKAIAAANANAAVRSK